MNDPLNTTLRFFAYICGKIFAVLCAVLFIILAFFTAINTMNVQVMLKDAFSLRSSVMLKQTDNSNAELIDKVFSKEYINKSGLITNTDNRAYDVTNYNQDTDIEFKIVWPWDKEVKLKVTDIVDDVRAKLVNDTVDASLLKDKYLMDSGTYEVTVKKDDSGWIIEDMKLEEKTEPEVIYPLPTPNTKNTEGEAEQEELDNQEDSPGEV